MKLQNNQAFTLVELIVVITILAILATIAFISFTGYSQNSRDSKRIADINSIQKSLELYITEKGTYPIPDYNANITYSGATAWIEGTVGDGVIRNIANINKKTLDPLTGNEYTYSVTSAKTEYQIGAISESGQMGYKLPVNQTYAASTKKGTAMIRGTYNERFLKVQSGTINRILALPSIIATDITQTELLTILSSKKLVYNNYNNIPHSYNNMGYIMTGGFDYTNTNPQVYSGSMKTLTDDNDEKKIFISNLKSAYNGTILHGEPNYKDIVNSDNTTNSTGAINTVISFINSNVGGIKVSNTVLPMLGVNGTTETPIYTCTGTLVIANATITNTGGLTANTSYQNTNSSNFCYYACKNGYTGSDCNPIPGDNVLLMHGEDNSGLGHIGNYVQFSLNGHLDTATDTAFNFDGGNYTIEMRFKGSDLNNVLFGRWGTATRWGLYFIEAGKLAFYNNASGWITIKSGIANNEWHHLVWTYDSNTNYFYIDGGLNLTYNSSITTTNPLSVGGLASVMFSNLGIDELRFYKGKRFTQTEVTNSYNRGLSGLPSNITDNLVAYYPFDTDFNDSVGTKHLTKVAGTAINVTGGPAAFIDSAKSRTTTAFGNVVHNTTTKKFGVSSIYFDGAGDYLQLPDSTDRDFGTGDFTIDFWANPTDLTANHIPFLIGRTAAGPSPLSLDIYAKHQAAGNGKIFAEISDTNGNFSTIITTTTAPTDGFHHYALVKSGATVTLYLDGNSIGSVSGFTQTVDDRASGFTIGADNSGNYFKGYIDEFRILKGGATRTSNFTPPTAAY